MTAATSITVRVPLAIRHRPGRKTVVTPMANGVAPVTTRADPTLVKALARAFRYQRMLDEGRYASITEMATAERIERGYLGSLLQLWTDAHRRGGAPRMIRAWWSERLCRCGDRR